MQPAIRLAATRSLSIGAKLAIRYTLATCVTVSMLGAFVYSQIVERINRQGTIVLEVSLQDLVDAFESQTSEHPREHVLAWFEQQMHQRVAESPTDLQLGIELLDEEGRPVHAAGSLAGRSLPISSTLAAHRQDRVLRAVNLGGEYAHLLMAAPVSGGFLRVAIDTRRFADNIAAFRQIFLVTLPLLLALTAALGWVLARASLRPIHEINRTARRIGGENLEDRIPINGSGDELDQLADTLNDMLARIHSNFERERRFTGNAAHQLLTPLTAIRNQVDVTLDHDRAEGEYKRTLEGVRTETGRLAAAVEAMLRLARSEEGLPPGPRVTHALGPILETVVEFFDPLAREKEIEVALDAAQDLHIEGDAGWLSEMFQNLLSNAIKFTPRKGRVEIRAAARAPVIVVEVCDTGPGIPGSDPGTVFERFSRAPGSGADGVGLGLPIAREIARAHGGEIEVETVPGGGTTFRVTLPPAAASERRSSPHENTTEA